MSSQNLFIVLIVSIVILNSNCAGQKPTSSALPTLGGPCEGCEAIYEFGDRELNSVDTLPAFHENEPKLRITGTVFHPDGKTPAENVVLYIYHTNRKGVYETKSDEKGWARQHGFIRGWIKTGANGKYTFYTFRPAPYPTRTEPEHIHITIKEPDRKEYYIDNYVFDDDPLLSLEKRQHLPNRGGSGITTPQLAGNVWLIQRDIILGLHIPHYK